MPKSQPKTTTLTEVKERLIAFIAAHGESSKAMDAKLDGITTRLDTLNGKVAEHEGWINRQKGERRATLFLGRLANALAILVCMFVSAAAGAWAVSHGLRP